MATIPQLMSVIPNGKNHALKARQIAQLIGPTTGGNEVETRNLIRDAILRGNVIISTPKNGYWQSNNKNEVAKCIDSLNNRAQEIKNRSDALKNAWNSANPNNIIP